MVTSLAVLLATNKIYYTKNPNQMSFVPAKLSLVNETTHATSFINKKSRNGKILLKRMYGNYDSVILNNDLSLSTPTAAEFTLPQLRYHCQPHIMREHPALRYELWKHEAPDVILLGSSMFFCNFSREVFYKHYPDKKLLDFTTGNNTPFIAHWFMKRADSLRLAFKPGTIVLYGMNRVEMLETYKNRNSHEYVKEAISGKVSEENHDEQIAAFLKLPQLRYDVTTALKDKYDAWFRGSNIYRKEIDKKYLVNETAFINYQASIATAGNTENSFDEERIKEIKFLAELLKKHDCRLIVLKLPQSHYNDMVMNTTGYSFFDKEMKKIESDNISYIDVSDLQKYNLSQLDYVWPDNIFDPEHLNINGAEKFTEALLRNVLDTMLTQKSMSN